MSCLLLHGYFCQPWIQIEAPACKSSRGFRQAIVPRLFRKNHLQKNSFDSKRNRVWDSLHVLEL